MTDNHLGPLPEHDVFAIGSLDVREDVDAFSDEAMIAERERCYALGVAAERDRRAPLMQAVEWLLNDGHMTQEHLARLRAAWESA